MEKVDLNFNHQRWQVYLRDQVDQSVFSEIFKFEEYRCAKEKIKQVKAPIFDVGAHIGLFTFYCRSLNPEVRIYAFEPENHNLKALKQNITENHLQNVAIESLALADKSGPAKLILTQDNHNHYLANDYDFSHDHKMQDVQAVSLSDFCQQNKVSQISLLKMDIEGGEYRVIDNFEKDNWQMIEAILLEYHHRSAQNYRLIEQKLRENKFSVQNFPSQFDKNMGFLWAVNKKIKFI